MIGAGRRTKSADATTFGRKTSTDQRRRAQLPSERKPCAESSSTPAGSKVPCDAELRRDTLIHANRDMRHPPTGTHGDSPIVWPGSDVRKPLPLDTHCKRVSEFWSLPSFKAAGTLSGSDSCPEYTSMQLPYSS
eukprot:CAMPEP_0204083862 /NCGR_PEP_ID=MMETSP0360-20130528/179187_1 /ASSEMBLY_ACC=CAM_ASM_000342 /TAXON_ID=268821 /ORGANISM="Scrippsiella Hangoei, Strain SHTV-5" /LENGTH=133 /DNA_ID=CAMNT_0051032813 /DNA_START=66 /DNA_END=464 /DNA_ORIENTATION=-